MPNFCVKSVKIYTWQKKFTRPPPVAPLTNMRYVSKCPPVGKFISIGVKKNIGLSIKYKMVKIIMLTFAVVLLYPVVVEGPLGLIQVTREE